MAIAALNSTNTPVHSGEGVQVSAVVYRDPATRAFAEYGATANQHSETAQTQMAARPAMSFATDALLMQRIRASQASSLEAGTAPAAPAAPATAGPEAATGPEAADPVAPTRARRSADDGFVTLGLSSDLVKGIKKSIFPLNRLMKSKRKLKERLEQDRSNLEAKIVALAITVNFTNVKRVEIKGYAAGVKELGVLVAEEAKKAMAAKLGVDPGVIHVSGGGGSDPVVGVKVRVIG